MQLGNGPIAFQHCYSDRNEVPVKDNQISQHPLVGGHEPTFSLDDNSGRIVTKLAKLTGKVDKAHKHVGVNNPGEK